MISEVLENWNQNITKVDRENGITFNYFLKNN